MFGNESSPLKSLMGMKVPGNESSKERKFHLWNFRSWEQKFQLLMTHWTVFWQQLAVLVSGASSRRRASGTRNYDKLLR